ncbi:Uncharacterised protein [Klebsiella pneumoniae]|nr:Uncharacterised protein [Klebsiella pneumoniae]
MIVTILPRHVAGGKGQPDRGSRINCPLRQRADGLQPLLLLSGKASDLMHQRRSGNPARLRIIRQGDIITHHHHLNAIAQLFGFFRRKAEVETVAGVVFDD